MRAAGALQRSLNFALFVHRCIFSHLYHRDPPYDLAGGDHHCGHTYIAPGDIDHFHHYWGFRCHACPIYPADISVYDTQQYQYQLYVVWPGNTDSPDSYDALRATYDDFPSDDPNYQHNHHLP
ncbi:hypothetical protein ONZ45_g13286 [Pleurotus djamor]|nr:hypothetical protein ONZ45_g13286 [Pleurotus djamor]